jgi:hypothetical protein
MLRIAKNPIFIVLITVITIIFYISLAKTGQKSITSGDQVKELEVETMILKEQTKNLEKKLQNSGEVEKVIRDDFLMKKTGEYVIKVPVRDEKEEEKERLKAASPWEKWKKVLF